MSSLELSEMKEVSFERLSEELGDQYIINTEESHPEFAYLAAIALETYDDPRYEIEDTLMEFIRNTSALDNLDMDDCDEISLILGEN